MTLNIFISRGYTFVAVVKIVTLHYKAHISEEHNVLEVAQVVTLTQKQRFYFMYVLQYPRCSIIH